MFFKDPSQGTKAVDVTGVYDWPEAGGLTIHHILPADCPAIVSEGVSVGESVFVFVFEGGEREGVRVAYV